MMNRQWLVVVFCATFWMTQVTGLTIEGFDAWEREWKELQCGPKGVEIETEGWNCSHLEPKVVTDAFVFCQSNVFPEGDIFAYMKAACENRTIFDMYNTCVDSFKDEVFVQEVSGMDDAMDCYVTWLYGRHGIESKFWKIGVGLVTANNETSTTSAE